MTESYPLRWPEGWPRTSPERRISNASLRTTSFDRARVAIFDELRRLKVVNPILSTNVPLRMDGMPYADAARRRMDDPGVAVYFSLRNKPMSMARDAYYDVAQNLRSLGLAIEYMRGLERHGGAIMMERAFSGFAQLPPPQGGQSEPVVVWRDVLGPFSDDKNTPSYEILAVAEARYRHKAKTAHTDSGGDGSEMIRLNLAIAQARKELA